MATTLHKSIITGPLEARRHGLIGQSERVSEIFWFLLSFALFVALGPFSAPVVLLVLCKLGLQGSDHAEPKSQSSS